ncbi:MAG TPA: Uma2 family endonuclease [Kofleriaceae bacterium]|nr:Uma2 family endonuclease [Kofleriaceae bacterium]
MDRRHEPHIAPPVPVRWSEVDHDQVIVLRGVSWTHYEALAAARDARQPRMAYLDGALEVMTTSRRHEIWKKLIARLVEAYVDETGGPLNALGSATFRKKAKRAGVEPDECYCVGRVRSVPELAIEVVHTSGGIDKLEAYRRLGVAEVWFWIEGRFWVYRQVSGRFEERSRSTALPGLDLDEVARIVISTDDSEQAEAVRAYRRSLRRR